MKPVLIELGFLRLDPQQNLRRITWITSGITGLMPLHAAGHLWDSSIENTVSHVVSSYIPSFKALAYSYDLATKSQNTWKTTHKEGIDLLIVSMPKSSGGLPPINARPVLDHLDRTTTKLGWSMPTKLVQPSKLNVLDCIHRFKRVFFACHGTTDPEDPSQSGLFLADGTGGKPERLTARDIANLNLQLAQLAYLEACSTAENPSPNLREEVIHLASSFQVAGFPHVIGTLWAVKNTAANAVAVSFFTRLTEQLAGSGSSGNRLLAPDYALALHQAVQELRVKGPGPRRTSHESDFVTNWAPFIHIGC